ncbi:MAG: hypothetical protein J1D77_06200 [Muribaculaceae bacterium]|nr:hypothetical protein [Muribaculaceae bacterium]
MQPLETGNYPYYIVPWVEEYKNLPSDSEEAQRLSRLIAANIGDYASLRLVLGIDPPEFGKFYPDLETSSPSTLATIDSFLEKYGGPNHSSETTPPGYVPEQTSLSLFIKEKRFDEAIQFIQAQNLNNPEKSIYFAHQIRFLKKLKKLDNFKLT